MRVRVKAYRNGKWRTLSVFEKGLFRASESLARLRGKIVSPSLMEMLRSIVSKLLQTPVTRIIQLGREHASRLLELYGENGVFKWAPSVRKWLKDPEYLFWLGLNQHALKSLGYV
jgi:hypothetical protein